uniref:Uncharacterized protein n=1 Tax=Nelumbo nucifera TaxID=4432 RepID=A0A822ZG23_NELNU|nr:TPA_asm: hypothetical protein HUJ06_001680 [Nelumbo nucifera]
MEISQVDLFKRRSRYSTGKPNSRKRENLDIEVFSQA